MTALSQLRLITRYGAYFALAGVAILLLAGFFVSAYQDRLFQTQRVREVSVQAQILAASLTATVAFGDEPAAREYVNALRLNPEIVAVGVYDAKDALFAGFSEDRSRPVPTTLGAARAYRSADRIEVFVPIRQASLSLGTVYVRAIDESSERRLARYAAIMLLAIMAALFLAVMATAQRALRSVNLELEERAVALADTNRLLQTEMEERERAEEALRQSQKMEAVGQLSGGVAHDFNNLLTIIKGSLHLLHKRLAQGNSDVQRYLDSANEGIDRAATLTRRLLAFSRRQPLSPSAVSISDLAAGMSEMVRHSVGERIRIEWRLNAQWKVVCDANQMESVILNLAINARDAMPEGGTLTIETRDVHLSKAACVGAEVAPGDHVELRISDTGTGMSDEVRKRALDPFFTTKPLGRGTGLGLSMAFGFIRQSNGTLHIDTAPGRGTTIVVLLARQPGDAAKEAA